MPARKVTKKPMSGAQRMEKLRKDRKARGLKHHDIWVLPENTPELKKTEKRLQE